ncbi:MAG: hypothetical protein ACD_61C00047G0003 [uncultured bacterium]|nr:MAG: hypothetical protein ACD_61C00047G0003 [uncultured bacterium]
MNLWTDMKPYFTGKNMFWGFVAGLIFSGLSLWSLGTFFLPALIFIPICTIGVPVIKYRDAELAKNYEDRL